MARYLLDSNIIIQHQRGRFNLLEYLRANNINIEECFLSEITVVELRIGDKIMAHMNRTPKIPIDKLIALFEIVPISTALDFFVEEKCRLQFSGTPLENNFDLLIACTAVVNEMTMVTDNIKDFKNIRNISIENWIPR